MIRLANVADFPFTGDTECAIRIQSLKVIYGCDVPFLRFYTDGEGSYMSLMDGVAVFYTSQPVSDEWLAFFAFQPEIIHIHTDATTGQQLAETGSWILSQGTTLKYAGEKRGEEPDICEAPFLPDVYTLLAANFPHIAPFEAWYVDYSHRVRHGHCHIAAIMCDGKPVSVATTVAETETAVILGQVATDTAFRCRGYAAKCLFSLINKCQGKELYILPVDKYAEKLYISLGFCPAGDWAELTRA